mmetsp:Transcript_37500/g.73806  ORF Transcript_37500/g.73806 Transcript_37500/m.73806 type:complete len:347 (-) Transcript_37500:1163-2203(-)
MAVKKKVGHGVGESVGLTVGAVVGRALGENVEMAPPPGGMRSGSMPSGIRSGVITSVETPDTTSGFAVVNTLVSVSGTPPIQPYKHPSQVRSAAIDLQVAPGIISSSSLQTKPSWQDPQVSRQICLTRKVFSRVKEELSDGVELASGKSNSWLLLVGILVGNTVGIVGTAVGESVGGVGTGVGRAVGDGVCGVGKLSEGVKIGTASPPTDKEILASKLSSTPKQALDLLALQSQSVNEEKRERRAGSFGWHRVPGEVIPTSSSPPAVWTNAGLPKSPRQPPPPFSGNAHIAVSGTSAKPCPRLEVHAVAEMVIASSRVKFTALSDSLAFDLNPSNTIGVEGSIDPL